MIMPDYIGDEGKNVGKKLLHNIWVTPTCKSILNNNTATMKNKPD